MNQIQMDYEIFSIDFFTNIVRERFTNSVYQIILDFRQSTPVPVTHFFDRSNL